jgi:peptide/nickel transport system substrate-binding protein
VVLTANDAYALGRPKIDEMRVKFIPDSTTMMANVLAGEVEATLGRALSMEQALEVRDRWSEAVLDTAPLNLLTLFPQYVGANPAIVADPQFRRAMLHATDRQGMVDAFQAGLGPIGHSTIAPGTEEHEQVERSIVSYPYDPRRATQMLEAMGLERGGDGYFRDSTGQRLLIDVRTTGGDDLREKVLLSVADGWQRAGVATEPYIIPQQRATDREFSVNYPAFELVLEAGGATRLADFHSRQARLPENNYSGNNRSRYRSAELDTLLDRYVMTIPKADRVRIMGDIVHHMTDQVVVLGLFRNLEPVLSSKRLTGVTARANDSTHSWNSWEWDLK